MKYLVMKQATYVYGLYAENSQILWENSKT